MKALLNLIESDGVTCALDLSSGRISFAPLGRLSEQALREVLANKEALVVWIAVSEVLPPERLGVLLDWVFKLSSGDPAIRVLACLKSNVAEDDTGMTFEIVPQSILHAGKEMDATRVKWTGTTQMSVDDLLSPPASKADKDHAKAVEVIREILAEGSLPKAEYEARVSDLGLSKSRLKKAERAAGVKRKPGGFGEPWVVFPGKQGLATSAAGERVTERPRGPTNQYPTGSTGRSGSVGSTDDTDDTGGIDQ